MALVKCRECGTSVSSKAKKCPHCGISNPARSTTMIAASVTVLLTSLLVLAMCSGNLRTTVTGTEPPDAEWLHQHGNDPKALDHRFSDKAQAACSAGANDFLRSIAAHDFAWDHETEGFFGIKFDSFGTRSAGNGLLTLISNRAKLSNGFGAFTHIDLYCIYDANDNKVVRYSQTDPASDTPTANEDPSNSSPEKSPPIVVYNPPNEASAEQPVIAPASKSAEEPGVTPQSETGTPDHPSGAVD